MAWTNISAFAVNDVFGTSSANNLRANVDYLKTDVFNVNEANQQIRKLLLAANTEISFPSGDLIVKMPDAAGVSAVSFHDSANAEVAYVDSDGIGLFAGLRASIAAGMRGRRLAHTSNASGAGAPLLFLLTPGSSRVFSGLVCSTVRDPSGNSVQQVVVFRASATKTISVLITAADGTGVATFDITFSGVTATLKMDYSGFNALATIDIDTLIIATGNQGITITDA